jgi:hypothetical protein
MAGRRALLGGAALLTTLAAAGCGRLALPQLRPAPSAPSRAPAPAATPAAAPSLETRIRREPWLTRFWEELTPAQRRRVRTRMRAASPEAAALAWDPMGLPERAALMR